MALTTLTGVRAARDFRRYRTTVVKCGAPGRIVALRQNLEGTTYTVRFTPPRASGATITLADLTDRDVCIG